MMSQSFSMDLQQLLPERRFAQSADAALKVSGLTIDSRQVEPGMAFLACRGEQVNGIQFVDQAVANGAAVILVAADQLLANQQVPVIQVEGLEQRLGELADRFYGSPSERVAVIGITGTNGKTSTSHFIASALDQLGSRAAVMGTNGYGFLETMNQASHTTPDVVRVQRMLAELETEGAQNLVMEVSSHALTQQRVDHVHFQQAVFTNLTRDHLDYHGNMANYGAAKVRLFTDYGIAHGVVNLDDPFAETLISRIPASVHISGYGLAPSSLVNRLSEPMICMERYHLSKDGIWGEMSTPQGNLPFKTHLLGRFNLSNLMAMVAVLQWRGYSNEQIAAQIELLKGVDGRMEAVTEAGDRLVVVDYAHTPDALEKALRSLRGHCQGQLWCLFGCGGDRDKGKRPLMAAMAERWADQVMVTSDNPRSEKPEAIIDDVRKGFKSEQKVTIEMDRAKAIAKVLQQSKAGDLVLVAGKGHEDYQEISGVRHPFSDRETILACVETAA